MRAALGLGELAVECCFEDGVDGIDGQRTGGVLCRRRWIIVRRGACGALVRDPATSAPRKTDRLVTRPARSAVTSLLSRSIRYSIRGS
jgi:hypothetical protein